MGAPSWNRVLFANVLLGVSQYRLWRDLGYAIGALIAGMVAEAMGLEAALWVVAALTFSSGLAAAVRMTETLHSDATRNL